MKYTWILISLLTAFILTSCSDKSNSDASLKIGINSWTGYDPFIVAKDSGIFDRNGVDVELIRYASTVDEIQAMKDGLLDGGGFTLDEVFTLVEAGIRGKIVLVVDYSKGGDMLIGQKHIKSVSDLVDKTVGYEGTVVGEFLLQRALEDNFIKKSAIKLINVNADRWLTAFKEKEVDALVCFNPVSEMLLSKHEGNLLYSSADIPFEIIDVLFIKDEAYNNKPNEVKKLLKSWFETLTFVDNDLEKAAAIVAKVKGITPQNFKTGLKGLKTPKYNLNISIMDPRSDKNIYKYSQKIVDFMLSKGLLSNRIDTTRLFNANLLHELKLAQ